MTTAVAELVEKALRLPADERVELIEAIWSQETPTEEFISTQMAVVQERMENVRNGLSELISAEEVRRQALETLDRNE